MVAESKSLTQILRELKTYKSSWSFAALKRRLRQDGINFEHLSSKLPRRGHSQNKKLSLNEITVEHSSYSRFKLKKRLLACGMLRDECQVCGLSKIWNGKPINMQIDHINGIPDDNRIENLRMICPNCHSQTETFAGNKCKKIRESSNGKTSLSEGFNLGSTPSSRAKRRKVVRPTKEVLTKLLWEKPTSILAKDFGVSDKAIEKWAKSYGLEKPTRGYWTKLKCRLNEN